MMQMQMTDYIKPEPTLNRQQGIILSELRRAGEAGLTSVELNDKMFRYSARIHELRNKGFNIEKQKMRQHKNLYRYILK